MPPPQLGRGKLLAGLVLRKYRVSIIPNFKQKSTKNGQKAPFWVILSLSKGAQPALSKAEVANVVGISQSLLMLHICFV